MKNTSVVPQGTIINGRVIGEVEKRDRGVTYYHWTCPVHGVEGWLRLKDIKARKGPRCCYVRTAQSNPNWRGTGILSAKKFNQIKSSALVRKKSQGGIEFSLTPEYLVQLWEYQNGKCSYTGWDLGDINSSAASLDRIWSQRGYVEKNVEWVHKDVNLAKQQLRRSEFINLCESVVNHSLKPEVEQDMLERALIDLPTLMR